MKLESYAIKEALRDRDIVGGIDLFLRHFSLPDITCVVGVNLTLSDVPAIIGYSGPYFYKWSTKHGFITNWDGGEYVSPPYKDQYTKLDNLCVWTSSTIRYGPFSLDALGRLKG